MLRVMTAVAICALAAAGAGRADDPEPDKTKEELKKLKGEWKVTKAMENKREQNLPDMTFTFDSDKMRWAVTRRPKGDGKGEAVRSARFKVKIDTKKEPHTIEMIPENGKNSLVGIYKIEKGELYLALPVTKLVNGNIALVTPRDFKGDGPVYVMKREKAKEKKAKEKGKE